MKILSPSENLMPFTKKFSKFLTIGITAITIETRVRENMTAVILRTLINVTSPGILIEFQIPWTLTMLRPVMENDAICEPIVLNTPIKEHSKLVIHAICLWQ